MSHLAPGTFLATLNSDEREALEGLGVRRTFPRDAALMFQNEIEGRVMLLLAGRVKVVRVDHDGHEMLLSIRDPGDVLGELGVIDGLPRIATVTTLEPVEALVMAAETFRRHLETTPRVAVAMLEVVTRRFRETTLKRSQFSASDTMGRLAARIVELADRYGEPSDEGVTVTSPLSREDLAAWTGASRAGVAHALQGFRELGWVHTERRQLLVRDLQALRARAE
jgi:CRP/FNR family transcriptional regulator, cyclic AMP receptor protein